MLENSVRYLLSEWPYHFVGISVLALGAGYRATKGDRSLVLPIVLGVAASESLAVAALHPFRYLSFAANVVAWGMMLSFPLVVAMVPFARRAIAGAFPWQRVAASIVLGIVAIPFTAPMEIVVSCALGTDCI